MFPGKITGMQKTFSPGIKEAPLKLVECKEYAELSPVVIFSTDAAGTIQMIEGRGLGQLDINKNVLAGRNIFSILPSDNEFLSRLKEIIFKEKENSIIEFNSYYFEVFCTYTKNSNGDVTGILGMAKDVSCESAVKDSQKVQKNYFAQLFENSPEAILIIDNDDRIINANKSFEKLFQFPLNEIKGQYVNDLIVPNELKGAASELSYNARLGETINIETVRKGADGGNIDVSIMSYPVKSGKHQVGIYAIYNDITKRKRTEEQIKKSLIEKEILLKEIHHRVKNNLQIIGSLLNFQTKYIKDKDALEKFKVSQNRIKSIALIHEKLYQTKNVSRIEFTSYVKSLVTHLFTVFGTDANQVSFKINANNTFLSVDNAIPCGLIINELVTNSLKYGFPDGKTGEVCIDLEYKNTNYFLTISDNGAGISDDINIENTGTLGMQLVKTLLIQLNAEMTMDRTNGTKYTIVFSNLNYSERI